MGLLRFDNLGAVASRKGKAVNTTHKVQRGYGAVFYPSPLQFSPEKRINNLKENREMERDRSMNLYKQQVCNSKNGDCLRACIATILQIPINLLPNYHSSRYFLDWIDEFYKLGIEFRFGESCWIEGYWIASVPSKNFKGSKHCIVMKGQEVFFDPSPKKKYKIGRNLLSTRLVSGGYTFIISDIKKLKTFAQ